MFDQLEQLAVVMPEQGSNYAAEWITQTLKIKTEPKWDDLEVSDILNQIHIY